MDDSYRRSRMYVRYDMNHGKVGTVDRKMISHGHDVNLEVQRIKFRTDAKNSLAFTESSTRDLANDCNAHLGVA